MEQFTIRINAWKRPEQLAVSLQHHASCEGVAQIQVVWCLDQGPPPDWLASQPKVIVEEHSINSLSERFRVLTEPATLGILSVDDDVLRPCLALDAAFDKWTYNPDRLVGLDARSHVVVVESEQKWAYAYLSTTEASNEYSTTLTRAAFVHVDYLHQYMNVMPTSIRDTVNRYFNCEDIALSLWVSSRTNGRPPLLADHWAVKSMVKLYSESGISSTNDHKRKRDECINDFADILHLKKSLKTSRLVHKDDAFSGLFDYGAKADNWNEHERVARLADLVATVQQWKEQGPEALVHDLGQLRTEAAEVAFSKGLIEKTDPWKERFHK